MFPCRANGAASLLLFAGPVGNGLFCTPGDCCRFAATLPRVALGPVGAPNGTAADGALLAALGAGVLKGLLGGALNGFPADEGLPLPPLAVSAVPKELLFTGVPDGIGFAVVAPDEFVVPGAPKGFTCTEVAAAKGFTVGAGAPNVWLNGRADGPAEAGVPKGL